MARYYANFTPSTEKEASDSLALVARLIREQNDLTLSELCEHISRERGVRVSVSTMYRALRRLGLPHKKS